MIQPKIKTYKVFACPDCRKKFFDLMSLNVHYTKAHPDKKLKFIFTKNKRVTSRRTVTVKAIRINRPTIKKIKQPK